MPDTNKHDHRERRCPRLGGPVVFSYCRQCGNDGNACFKILDCWWEHFDVVSEMKRHLSAHEFERLLNARPKPKLISLLEIIDQVKARSP